MSEGWCSVSLFAILLARGSSVRKFFFDILCLKEGIVNWDDVG